MSNSETPHIRMKRPRKTPVSHRGRSATQTHFGVIVRLMEYTETRFAYHQSVRHGYMEELGRALLHSSDLREVTDRRRHNGG